MEVKELKLEEIQHEHPLTIKNLQEMHINYEEDDDDFDDNAMIKIQMFNCTCDMCGIEIDWYHRFYYTCSESSCNYRIHKLCKEMPTTLNFPGHPSHTLVLKKVTNYAWKCQSCLTEHKDGICYQCFDCKYEIDLRCAMFVEQTTINHPGHPHPLISDMVNPTLCKCSACGEKHEGVFYNCPTCFNFSIHSDCVSLPIKLSFQNHPLGHDHLLTLSYSFLDQLDGCECKICRKEFDGELWLYKCSKCMYYVHLGCATRKEDLSKSIVLTDQFEDVDHFPLSAESYNILPAQIIEPENSQHGKEISKKIFKFDIHEHDLNLIDTETSTTMSLHNPMKRTKVLCSACLRPITTMPYFKCSNEGTCSNFVLHKWCTLLRPKLQNHPCHLPNHSLVLQGDDGEFVVFDCGICQLPSNGFAYSCESCDDDYKIDVNCGFIPERITHEAHPEHSLTRVLNSSSKITCRACRAIISEKDIYFSCSRDCGFFLDQRCGLRLPKTIRHKYDKHDLELSYSPIPNHKSQYFCEICEEDLNPYKWFYHCKECAQSVHSACAPLILKSEQGVNSHHLEGFYKFINMKFGGVVKRDDHEHDLWFHPGTLSDNNCNACGKISQSKLILKCLKCKYVLHYYCHLFDYELFDTEDIERQYDSFEEKPKEKRQLQAKTFYPTGIMRPATRPWKALNNEHP